MSSWCAPAKMSPDSGGSHSCVAALCCTSHANLLSIPRYVATSRCTGRSGSWLKPGGTQCITVLPGPYLWRQESPSCFTCACTRAEKHVWCLICSHSYIATDAGLYGTAPNTNTPSKIVSSSLNLTTHYHHSKLVHSSTRRRNTPIPQVAM